MAKVEKVIVNGKGLTQKEKFVFDKVVELGKVNSKQIANEEYGVRSIIATLAYLDTKQGLLTKVLEIDKETNKPITMYVVKEMEETV